MENPFMIDYSKLASTNEGRAWLEKAIHPPGSANTAVKGMPDYEANPSTVMEWRNTTTIDPPVGTETSDTWNCLILQHPNPEVPASYWRWKTGDPEPTLASEHIDIFNESVSNWFNFETLVSRWRRLYGSGTYEFNAPALSNQGMVYCAQKRPELMNVQATVGAAYTNHTVTTPVQAVISPHLPTDPQYLMQISPRSYKHRAIEGCFCVSGLVQPTNLFQAGSDVTLFMNETPVSSSVAFPNPKVIGNRHSSDQPKNVGYSDNWSIGWVLFRGLSGTGTIETKFIHGYEVQPAMGSILTSFVDESAEPDTLAIEAYYHLRHGMLDGYPASFNFFGTLWKGIKSLVPKITKHLLPAIKEGGKHLAKNVTQELVQPEKANPRTQSELQPAPAQTSPVRIVVEQAKVKPKVAATRLPKKARNRKVKRTN